MKTEPRDRRRSSFLNFSIPQFLNSSISQFSPDSPYRNLLHLDCRDSHSNRHVLPLFAADSNAVVELQVVTNHGDLPHHVRAVADQGGVADGARDAAILDEVAFGGRKDEVAAGDIYLAAAEGGAIEPAVDRLDDILRIVLAGHEEGIGHTRHGYVLVALAAAVAGGRRAENA